MLIVFWVFIDIIVFIILPYIVYKKITYAKHPHKTTIFDKNLKNIKRKIKGINNIINILTNNNKLIRDSENIDNAVNRIRIKIITYLKNHIIDYCEIYLNIIIQNNVNRIINNKLMRKLNISLYINELSYIIDNECNSILKLSRHYKNKILKIINSNIDVLKIELTELQTKLLIENISPIENYSEIHKIKNITSVNANKDKLNELEENYIKIIDELKSIKEIE